MNKNLDNARDQKKSQYLNKAGVKTALTLLILLPLILFAGISFFDLNNDPNQHRPWVSWYDDPAHEVYIGWETEEKTTGTLYYGTSKSALTTGITELGPENIHHLNLTGLTADTLYYYEVRIDGGVFADGQFRTAPLGYSSFDWVMTSDTQQPKLLAGHHQRIAAAIENKNYTFINIVGDWVDDGGNKKNFNNFFATASVYTDTIPFAPVVGNHDEHDDSDIFRSYFINSVDDTPTEVYPHGQFYYSYNWSCVHFTMCHFTRGSTKEFTAEQIAWLEEDLEDAKDMPFRVVMFHHPVVGSGFFRADSEIDDLVLPLLEEYNVSVVVSGHEHHFERGTIQNSINEENDITYFILGGGGGAFDPGLTPQPETEVLTATPNYTCCHAESDSITFTTYTPEGALIDEYTINSGVGA